MQYNKSGFTLIEITIALLILGVGLVGILTLFPVGFDALGRATNITLATFLAQEKMEEIKRDGYDGATIQDALDTSTPYPNDEFENPYENYEWEVQAIDGVPNPPNPRRLTESICEVTVTVYWPADKGLPGSREAQQNVELKTYIPKYVP